ncbi:MAG: imidazole glycerol phosphate synthase subunit HisH [Anaerolineaceae bacterium]
MNDDDASMKKNSPKIAIVDYSLGNLFSIKHACEHIGLDSVITSSKQEILAADAVLLPGMGAYGDAMDTLHRLDLVTLLRDIAQSKKLLVGICLGIQLLMSESCEFGRHKGLGIIEGTVEKFENPQVGGKTLKIPQVGWNKIVPSRPWINSPLENIQKDEYMYFVHSYYPHPRDSSIVLATTNYGGVEFCSSLQHENVFACLFHPERSGHSGLKIYASLSRLLKKSFEDYY